MDIPAFVRLAAGQEDVPSRTVTAAAGAAGSKKIIAHFLRKEHVFFEKWNNFYKKTMEKTTLLLL